MLCVDIKPLHIDKPKSGEIPIYEHGAMSEARRIYGDRWDMALIERAEDALDNADALAVATEWREFRNPGFGSLVIRLNKPVIIDGRNIYDSAKMRQLGIACYGVGRGRQ